jgi:hypothetical protein
MKKINSKPVLFMITGRSNEIIAYSVSNDHQMTQKLGKQSPAAS